MKTRDVRNLLNRAAAALETPNSISEIERAELIEDLTSAAADGAPEWSGFPDPADPDNHWIDDETGERVNAHTGERQPA